jgi:hypothetical protein
MKQFQKKNLFFLWLYFLNVYALVVFGFAVKKKNIKNVCLIIFHLFSKKNKLLQWYFSKNLINNSYNKKIHLFRLDNFDC